MVDIQVNNLTKFFVIGENLLQGLSFDIQEGERVAILGRNGCGKTTLFKILTGEMEYDDGEVFVNPNKRLGLISQIPDFPAHYTVEDVLRSAYAEVRDAKRQMERLERDMANGATSEQLRQYDMLVNRFQSGGGYEMDVEVDKICNGLAITAAQRTQPFESLSGGEKTRVNLARLLLEKTDILLLDEPTNHLDLKYQQQIFSLIGEWLKTPGRAVLSVVHDLSLARAYGTRALLMDEGRVVAQGAPQAVFAPETLERVYGMDVYGWMRGLLGQWRAEQASAVQPQKN